MAESLYQLSSPGSLSHITRDRELLIPCSWVRSPPMIRRTLVEAIPPNWHEISQSKQRGMLQALHSSVIVKKQRSQRVWTLECYIYLNTRLNNFFPLNHQNTGVHRGLQQHRIKHVLRQGWMILFGQSKVNKANCTYVTVIIHSILYMWFYYWYADGSFWILHSCYRAL